MDGGGHDGFISKPYTRTGNNSTQDGLVEYSIEAKPEIKSIFKDAELPTPSFNKLKKNDNKAIDTFKNAIAKAKQSLGDYGASVELKDDYTDINLYLSEDGESGFGIKPNGDIVSVFSNNKAEGGRSAYMLEMAISQGGRQLDCFDVYLVEIYEAHGFKPVAKMKWDDEYIPEGWNKDNFKDYNNGEPDVVFMVYDPNNDIEKRHESGEDTMAEIEKKRGNTYKRKTREEKIPYIVDYDDGEDIQHIHKWRSPAEREAIYNNMLERYKNAKTTEELKKVVFDNDKPLEVFNRQLDDLGSLSQSIKAEYSKRYLELIKDENPEEYKKNKKYLENKYKFKSDARVHIDSLIDTIEYIDAKKKEFKESDVNRDEDGKFATKNSSKNKSNDNDKKDNTVKTVDEYNKDITQKYNSIENETYKDFINENKEKIAKKQADVIHNIMTDFFKDIANDKELENKIKDFTDDELMTFAIYKKIMENKKVFVDNQIQSNPELSMQLMSDGEILKNIASFSNHFPDENRFTKEGIASLKKILPLCQTFDKLYRGDGWKIEDVKKLKVGDSFRQPNKNDIDILNLSKSKSIAEEYAREGAKWSSDFVRITHTFENAQGFDNSYFSFFEDDEEVFIDKSEFILGSIEGDNKNGFNLIWYRKK